MRLTATLNVGLAGVALAACFGAAPALAQLPATDFVADSPVLSAPDDFGVFSPGTTTVGGFVNLLGQSGEDVDIFTFEIAAGTELTAITGATTQPNRAFIAIAAGDTFPQDPNTISPGNATFLGSTLFGANTDPNLLPIFATGGAAGTGFTEPLGPGDYTVYLQQIGNNPFPYALSFEVIPEPGSLSLLGVAGAALLRWRR